jgi:hypothetical protein
MSITKKIVDTVIGYLLYYYNIICILYYNNTITLNLYSTKNVNLIDQLNISDTHNFSEKLVLVKYVSEKNAIMERIFYNPRSKHSNQIFILDNAESLSLEKSDQLFDLSDVSVDKINYENIVPINLLDFNIINEKFFEELSEFNITKVSYDKLNDIFVNNSCINGFCSEC